MPQLAHALEGLLAAWWGSPSPHRIPIWTNCDINLHSGAATGGFLCLISHCYIQLSAREGTLFAAIWNIPGYVPLQPLLLPWRPRILQREREHYGKRAGEGFGVRGNRLLVGSGYSWGSAEQAQGPAEVGWVLIMTGCFHYLWNETVKA